MTNDFYNPSDEQLQDLVDEGAIPSLSEESYSEYEDDEHGDYRFESDEYDGQPDEYTEWQDVNGGDDWDHGQYDCMDY